MKLAFNTWVYSSFPVWVPAYPIDEVIKRLAKIGYDGIEIGAASPVAYPEDLDKAERQRILGLLKANKIAIASVLPAPGGGPGYNAASPIDTERKRSVQYYKDCVDLAYDLGAKVVLYVCGWQIFGVSTQQAWNWSRESLTEIAKYALPKGVMLAVEPTPTDSNLVETADDAIRLMEEVNMTNVKLMFDTYHVFYRNEILTDYVYKMRKDLIHVHMSDVNRLPPGSVNDFRLFIDALKEIGYDGYLSMEIGFDKRGNDPDVFALKSYEYLKNLIL